MPRTIDQEQETLKNSALRSLQDVAANNAREPVIERAGKEQNFRHADRDYVEETRDLGRKKKMKKCAALLALLAATSANSAIMSSEASLFLETTEINQTLSLNRFDATLGTLTDVDITLRGQGVSTASVENNSPQEQMFRFSSVLDLLFAGPALNEIVTIPLFDTLRFVSIGSATVRDLGRVDRAEELVLDVFATNFGAFVGPGTFDLTCESVVSQTVAGGGGNLNVTQTTQAGCGATVAYTYVANVVQPLPPTAVSEPGSMALAGLGLFGMAALRRRR